MTRLINYGIRCHPRITCALIVAACVLPHVFIELRPFGEI